MLPRFFESGISVSNHAESGRALYSFRGERRLKKILSTIKPDDYLFIQFGHNDQKNKAANAGPFTTYKDDLADFVNKVRKKNAHPVIISPMERRRWSGGEPGLTLGQYAEAAKQVAGEMNVPYIDLHAMSLEFYKALGKDDSKKAFVHYPAGSFPGQYGAFKDDTHHNNYGAYQLARGVVEGIRKEVPALAKYLRADVEPFQPSLPEKPEELDHPVSIFVRTETPEGR
jgi:lysophospholipase L1-like esterase